MENLTPPQMKALISAKILNEYGCEPEEATQKQIYGAVCTVINDILLSKRGEFLKKNKDYKGKKVYYFSMEFLQGTSLKNNVYNLGLEKSMQESLAEYNVSLDDLCEMEPDAGLGNGGLGRLASCYMDGLATQGFPAEGFSIRYEFGIFKQEIVDGWQVEFPDNWLENGSYWLEDRADEAVEVHFGGHIDERWEETGLVTTHSDYDIVRAVPYDMMISGYDSQCVNSLRLWRAQAANNFDMSLFSRGEYIKSMENSAKAEAISKVLYPADNHYEGKMLRLKQQYFFVSASLQTILKKHLIQNKTLDNLPEKAVIHINDTHPALCVPELMRILMDENGYSWEAAWSIATKTLAYTNHTVMSEALEVWPIDLFKTLLPRIYSITEEINRRFCNFIFENFPEKRDKIESLSIISKNLVHMANMCVCACFSVNGVSKLHSDILKRDLFKDYNDIFPNKLTNVTNGIAHRRWLCQSNPLLADYLSKLIGTEFEKDLSAISKLNDYAKDKAVLSALADIKRQNKVRLAKYIASANGINVNPDSIFDIQVKRLHEYKRQMLNALHIYYLYKKVKFEGAKIVPRTFIFGAKASPGYFLAKEIIRFICALGEMINKDPDVRDYIKVIFLADYKVSVAELIMPACDVSEQISQAGKEASGTGNMKLMLGGGVTIGTMDGANIEIYEQVGANNIFIFGMTTPQVNDLAKSGYHPQDIYKSDPLIKDLLDSIKAGGVAGKNFDTIVDNLINSDTFMTLADFRSYVAAQEQVSNAYADKDRWNLMSLRNTANAGIFAADRSVRDYAQNIWKTKPYNKN